MNNEELICEINRIKKEKNAVLLVHNYQMPDIYKVADFIGDSLELCLKAKETSADIIVFCGVDFMTESAKILNPEKLVLHPNRLSVCPMANMVSAEQITALKSQNPGSVVVSYVNTTAEVKAVSDICCTSANAVKIVNSLKENTIIFAPDKNLGSYVAKNTDKKVILVDGHCYVHNKILPESVKKAKENYPDALVLVHPECTPEVVKLADKVCSTSQMAKTAAKDDSKEFIIVTECGMTEKLKLDFPNKTFYTVGGTCIQMKKITLQDVYDSLTKWQYEVNLPEDIIDKAKLPLQRMIDLS